MEAEMRRMLATVVLVGMGLSGGTAAAGGGGPSGSVPVQLVSITDFHGYLRPPSPADGGTIAGPGGTTQVVGGAAYLATHLQNIRADHPNSILFSDGDNFSGWPFEVDAHADEPTIEALNAL